MKKVLLSIAVLAFAAGSISAQELSVNAGYVNSNAISKNDKKPYNGLTAGVNYTYYLNQYFGVSAGLNYTYLGREDKSSTDILGTNTTITATTKEHFINLPVMAVAKYNLQKGMYAFVEAGPTFNYGVSSKTNVKTVLTIAGNTNTSNSDTDNYSGTNYGQFDLMLGAKAGIKVNSIKLFVGYNYGLIDLDKTPDNDDAVLHRGQFSAGVAFCF